MTSTRDQFTTGFADPLVQAEIDRHCHTGLDEKDEKDGSALVSSHNRHNIASGVFIVSFFYALSGVCVLIADYHDIQGAIRYRIWTILMTILYLITSFLSYRWRPQPTYLARQRGVYLFILGLLSFLTSLLGYLYITEISSKLRSIYIWSNFVIYGNGILTIGIWLYCARRHQLPKSPVLDISDI